MKVDQTLRCHLFHRFYLYLTKLIKLVVLYSNVLFVQTFSGNKN